MSNWYLKRLGQAALTIFVVVNLTFFLIRLLPGGPMAYLRAQLAQQSAQGSGTSQSRLMNLMETYTNVRPNDPLYIQWWDYISSVFQGDLGKSIWYKEPVADVLLTALPWTLFVMSISILSMFVIGVGLGAVMAYTTNDVADSLGTLVGMFFNSVPYYVAALVFLYVLSFQLGWFPTGGYVSSDVTVGANIPFLTSALYHATLPILSFVLTRFGLVAVTMRGNSVSVLGEDYLRVAELRGLSDRRIVSRYVVRNAVLPMYTGLLISIGFMFGGAIILEQIFNYHGIGYYIYQAISTRDYPLMMGGFILITTAVVAAMFIADLTYGYLDPRLSKGGSSHEY